MALKLVFLLLTGALPGAYPGGSCPVRSPAWRPHLLEVLDDALLLVHVVQPRYLRRGGAGRHERVRRPRKQGQKHAFATLKQLPAAVPIRLGSGGHGDRLAVALGNPLENRAPAAGPSELPQQAPPAAPQVRKGPTWIIHTLLSE